MSKLFWIIIALGLAIITAEPAINNNEDDAIVSEDISDNENPDLNFPRSDKNLPSPAELLKMLDSMGGMSDEEKQDLREHLMKKMQSSGETIEEGQASASYLSNFSYQILLLLGMLSLLAIIFGNYIIYVQAYSTIND